MLFVAASSAWPSVAAGLCGATASVFARSRAAAISPTAGDCVACHTAPTGQAVRRRPDRSRRRSAPSIRPTSRPIATPASAAGATDEFYRAMHEGVGPRGDISIRRFPYPYFTKATRSDVDGDPRLSRDAAAGAACAQANLKLPGRSNWRLSRCAAGTALLRRRRRSSAESAQKQPGMESRRLPGRRPRPLRRLPHRQEFRRRSDEARPWRAACCRAGSRPT